MKALEIPCYLDRSRNCLLVKTKCSWNEDHAKRLFLCDCEVSNNWPVAMADPGFPGGGAPIIFRTSFGKAYMNMKKARLHSSRMHTACALSVSPGMLCSGGRGCLSQGVPAWSREGGVWHPSMHWCRPPCEQNHRHLWKYYLAPTSLRAVKTRSPLPIDLPINSLLLCYLR